jgi:hypothetical protein
MKDSLGRETDHLTPCDEGQHSKCTDEGCDCDCHSAFWQTVSRIPEVLTDIGPALPGKLKIWALGPGTDDDSKEG